MYLSAVLKMRYIHITYILTYILEHCLAMKKELLPFETIWMDLMSIMPYEISQAEKDKYCMVSLI